ncbi:hypothetical protein [Nostoc sp. PCC 7524]|uniref:hypothetical protein n=1 Tax=Nostoc sp. (strain ATCC 29411 / PCC 7524) TaxID=28072 RepID=UPI000A5CAA47|nr:hypothetical protein [Nostoc sp. PCC 7524]
MKIAKGYLVETTVVEAGEQESRGEIFFPNPQSPIPNPQSPILQLCTRDPVM